MQNFLSFSNREAERSRRGTLHSLVLGTRFAIAVRWTHTQDLLILSQNMQCVQTFCTFWPSAILISPLLLPAALPLLLAPPPS